MRNYTCNAFWKQHVSGDTVWIIPSMSLVVVDLIFCTCILLGSVRYIEEEEIEMVHRITIEKGKWWVICHCQLSVANHFYTGQ